MTRGEIDTMGKAGRRPGPRQRRSTARERAEARRLYHEGDWEPARIAAHLGFDKTSVSRWLRADEPQQTGPPAGIDVVDAVTDAGDGGTGSTTPLVVLAVVVALGVVAVALMTRAAPRAR